MDKPLSNTKKMYQTPSSTILISIVLLLLLHSSTKASSSNKLSSSSGSMYVKGLQLPLRLRREETIDDFAERVWTENIDLFSSQESQTIIRLRDWAKQKRRVHQRESETFRWNLQRESAKRALLADDRVDVSVLTPAPQGIDRFRIYNDGGFEDWLYAHAHHQYDLGTDTLSMIGTAEGFWQFGENVKFV